MLYFNGQLEVTSEVRSIPLGAKRKPGRPKKLPNPLTMSPAKATESNDVENPPAVDEIPADVLPALDEIPVEGAPVRKTTRKRKRAEVEPEPTVQSPVDALLAQSRSLTVGLGAPKPAKKTKRLPARSKPSTVSETPKLPPTINCKKRKGSCNHEVVFSKHYDRSLWTKYADQVRSKKSSVILTQTML